MRISTALFGAATLIGIGVYVGKKLIGSKESIEDESVVFAEEKETYGEKFHKASMFAVGAVKTSVDKIAEGIKDIANKDMVKKGEETIEQAKEATEQIKKDIDDLKNMVVSINVTVGEEEEPEIKENENEVKAEETVTENDFMETSPSSFNDDMEEM